MAVIGIFDSGSGGLSVLREVVGLAPGARCIYYSDNANCPYGDKSVQFIRERSLAVCRELVGRGADVIVVACNTATSAAIGQLRSSLDLPVVGLEPAVKPAVAITRSGVVGVLATAATLKGEKYLENRQRYADRVRIVERVGRGFVELVESCRLDGDYARKVVSDSLQPLLDEGADVVVLGCTHYPFLMPLMESIAEEQGRKVRFLDPAPAVARHLMEVLAQHGIDPADAHPGVKLLSSGPDDSLRRLYENFTKFAD